MHWTDFCVQLSVFRCFALDLNVLMYDLNTTLTSLSLNIEQSALVNGKTSYLIDFIIMVELHLLLLFLIGMATITVISLINPTVYG
jgi:hypothetical protein